MEWKGVVASIIFLGGCNFRCLYCHNHTFAFEPSAVSSLSFDDILLYLNKKKGWLDGVVISGGEPTIYGDELAEFVKIFKKRGLKVKIFTNGYNYEVIEGLIREKLIDAISMDIKHVLDRYIEIVRVSLPHMKKRIKKAIEIIRVAQIDREFRITLMNGYHSFGDVALIKELVNPCRLILQNVYSDLIREDEKAYISPLEEKKFLEIKKCFEV